MATLEDIVSAAAKVFRTKGYHAATVRDIADEVGLLKGSLYHHFDSKEELLYLVVKEPIAQMYRTMAEIAAADGRATDKLRRAISAHLEAFDRHYPHLFVYLRERESVKRRFREMIGFSPKDYERCWQQILREGEESGEFRTDLDIQVASYRLADAALPHIDPATPRLRTEFLFEEHAGGDGLRCHCGVGAECGAGSKPGSLIETECCHLTHPRL